MVLFRSAVKQIARRHGYHATFMCRPKLPNVFASGWHLHQSITARGSGENAFMAKDGGELLSEFGRCYLAGLLQHARASAVFSTPTINGYKRYRSYSLAPDRAIWGRDNRGVMIRVLGGPEDPATRLENRIGEPAANPYLYMASQVLAGLDGIDRKLTPPLSADTPYETKAPLLPLRILRLRTLAGSNLSALVATGAVFSQFFLLTLYMQQVLHYSALKTGVAYIGLTLTTIALSAVSQALVTRLGVRTVLPVGLVLSTVALVLFAQGRFKRHVQTFSR